MWRMKKCQKTTFTIRMKSILDAFYVSAFQKIIILKRQQCVNIGFVFLPRRFVRSLYVSCRGCRCCCDLSLGTDQSAIV